MADSRHTEQPFSLRKLLGLPDSAPGARVRAEATRLLEHIESRLGGAKDEGFAAARRLEIRHLRGFLATELARRTRSPRSHWGALIAGFLLGGASVAGWVLIAQDPPPPAPQAATDLPGELSVLADPPNSTWALFDLGDQHLLGEHPADLLRDLLA